MANYILHQLFNQIDPYVTAKCFMNQYQIHNTSIPCHRWK